MSMSSPLITVVVPVYNRESRVAATLEALSAQTWRDFAVVLVDNNSTDGTAAVLRRWADAQPFEVRVLSENKAGAAAARQRGLEAVTSPWTMFFDSDDLMSASHIARAAEAIALHPEADIIGWDIRFHFADGSTAVKPFATEDVQFMSLFHGTMSTQRYCARSSLFNRAGGWNPEVGVWDDIELGARLLALRPRMIKLKGEPQVDVYVSDDSISHGEQAANIDVLDRALGRIAASLGPGKEHWTELKRVITAARSPFRQGRRLYREVMQRAPKKRFLLRAAYYYTLAGGRGAATIARRFL